MFVQLENDANTGNMKLILPEEIRISNSEEFKKDLLVAADGENSILIDGSKVNRIDTSAIQLLVALSHDCNKKGSPLKWYGASDKLVSYVKLLGLKDSLGLK
jgi:anti-anti-sigma regulatory factor